MRSSSGLRSKSRSLHPIQNHHPAMGHAHSRGGSATFHLCLRTLAEEPCTARWAAYPRCGSRRATTVSLHPTRTCLASLRAAKLAMSFLLCTCGMREPGCPHCQAVMIRLGASSRIRATVSPVHPTLTGLGDVCCRVQARDHGKAPWSFFRRP